MFDEEEKTTDFIILKDIEKTYSANGTMTQALKNINLKVDEGEIIAVIGPSGSGKSTLLSVVSSISTPSSGKVVVDDIDVFALTDELRADFRREYLGFVFQAHHLVPYLTARENVMLPFTFSDIKTKEAHGLAKKALEKVGLGNKMERFPGQLSGGEQSRVAIARAIVNNPPVVLADEPTGNLDSKTGEKIMKLLSQLNKEGLTVIFVTHNQKNIEYADRIIELKDGVLLQIREGKA